MAYIVMALDEVTLQSRPRAVPTDGRLVSLRRPSGICPQPKGGSFFYYFLCLSAQADGERRGAGSNPRLRKGLGEARLQATSSPARVLGVRRRHAPRC